MAHSIPKNRHRSRYTTTSKLEEQSRRLEDNHDDIMADESMFDNELKTLDEQYKDVDRVSEARVDAHNVSLLASIEQERNKRATAACAQITVINLRDGLQSYHAKRKRRTQRCEGVVNLFRLGQDIGAYFNRLPSLEFMFGAIDQVRKKRKVRKLRLNFDDTEDAPLKTPKEVNSHSSKQIERMSTQRALALHGLMKEKQITVDKKRDLLDFLVCPKSFSETVENIFDFAHLVERGNAQIKDLGDDNVVIGTAAASKKGAGPAHTENQIILGLDMADWRALSEGREHGAIQFRGGAET